MSEKKYTLEEVVETVNFWSMTWINKEQVEEFLKGMEERDNG